jgi:hypothetical protein
MKDTGCKPVLHLHLLVVLDALRAALLRGIALPAFECGQSR